MGYRSDVRIIIKETDFQRLEEYVKKEMGGEEVCYLMKNKDVKTERLADDGTKYIYFGWDDVKWYKYSQGYKEVCLIDEFIMGLDSFHYAIIGEDLDDIEEHYNLDGEVEGIDIIRKFND